MKFKSISKLDAPVLKFAAHPPRAYFFNLAKVDMTVSLKNKGCGNVEVLKL